MRNYPDYDLKDVEIITYSPGKWEEVLTAIYIAAKDQQDRCRTAQYNGYGWI